MRGTVLPILFGIVALGLIGLTDDAFADHRAGHAPEGGWQAAVALLQTQIDSFFDVFVEVGELESEQQARIAADQALQQKTTDNMMGINDNTARIDSFFDVFIEVAELDAEEAARIAADEALQRALEDAINQEIAAREAADQALQVALDAEAAARLAADNQLQSDLTSEADARAAADQLLETLFDSKLQPLADDIDSEEARALQAEADLLRALEQEILDRQAGDAQLQQKTTDNMMGINDNTARIDSFFDVFTEISVHDRDVQEIQTELLALELRGVNPSTGAAPDSFFDVFTEISVHDRDVQEIQTEIIAMDLRGNSCGLGDVVTGVAADGALICVPQGPLFSTYTRDGPRLSVAPGEIFNTIASCDSGDIALSGGYTQSRDILVWGEGPTTNPTEWFVSGINPADGIRNINALVLCADMSP